MGKFIDITGQKFGRLTALYKLHNCHKDHTYWLCICECGNLTEVNSGNLRNNHTRSCGCLNKDTITKHGKFKTRLYRIWRGMKDRCHYKTCKAYTNYGARGIIVCDEWKDDFETFYNWAMDNNYRDDLTIDRIDYNKNYTPDNCRWVDRKTQNRNMRNNRNYTIDGETKCLAEWCEIMNLNYDKVYSRIMYYNWSIERALELEE